MNSGLSIGVENSFHALIVPGFTASMLTHASKHRVLANRWGSGFCLFSILPLPPWTCSSCLCNLLNFARHPCDRRSKILALMAKILANSVFFVFLKSSHGSAAPLACKGFYLYVDGRVLSFMCMCVCIRVLVKTQARHLQTHVYNHTHTHTFTHKHIYT